MDVAHEPDTDADDAARAVGQWLARPTGDKEMPADGFNGYFAQRKRKLAAQAAQLADAACAQIFVGVVVHIDGYTEPPHYELKRLLVQHGARFQHYLAKAQVTHIVAAALPLGKERKLAAYRVVRPAWVVDSVRAGRRLAWQAYALGAGAGAAAAVARPPGHPGLAPVVDRFDEGLNRPWVRRNLATAPGFVARYYASSRLHHLMAWKAEMQDLVGRLRSQQPSAPSDGRPRVIMHVDFDCFFVSVALLQRPELRGKPAAVCHAQEDAGGSDASTSQIASCSYAARAHGVRNGMLLGQALALCPQLVTVAYDFAACQRIARAFFAVAVEMSDETQVVSVDEALLDVSARVHGEEEAVALAEEIRVRVRQATGCTVSVGIGPSACVARAATRRAKPDGALWLSLDAYLALPLGVGDLVGVGGALAGQLAAAGLQTLGDVRQAGLARTQATVGDAHGASVFEGSWGRDAHPVKSDTRRQAFGCEIGWGVRLSTADEAEDFVRQLAQHAFSMMRDAGRWAGAVTLRVKVRREGAGRPAKFLGHGVCDAVTRTVELRERDAGHVAQRCVEALRFLDVEPLDVRAVGVRLHRLEDELEAGRGVKEMLAAAAAAAPSVAAAPLSSVACAMPTASQVDPAVLAELPADVRREIEQHYAGATTSVTSAATAAPARPSTVSRRGRPRKHAPLALSLKQQQKQRRLTDAFRRVERLDEVMPSQADAAVWADLPTSVRRNIARSYVRDKPPVAAAASVPSEPEAAVVQPDTEESDSDEPALCGARTVSDVCSLVERWVAHDDKGALPEDEDALADYLAALVRAHRVVMAAEVLRHLARCVARQPIAAWRRTLSAVRVRVNAACSAMYDAQLDV
ncbi:deoxycytidyl transferase [Coemansia sp. RSA 2607]|nr:deoxycytidyl transferase [Coemansia sp. RSA 2607]